MLRIYIVMIMTTVCYRVGSCAAVTLADIVYQSSILPEYVVPDNHNLLVPDYLSVYKQSAFPWLLSLSVLLYTAEKPRDGVERVQRLLDQVVRDRELQGFSYPHVGKLKPQSGAVLLVWSDLQSGFHSLVRALVDLHRKNIIDNELAIIADNYYFIFNGNAVGIAPYNLELLAVILQLMIKNKDKVFYITGLAEDRELWIEQGLLRQAGIIVGLEGAKFATGAPYARFKQLEGMLSRFFATLPRALYVDYMSDKHHDVLQFSALGIDTTNLATTQYGDFFDRPFTEGNNAYATYRTQYAIPTTGDVRVQAYIMPIDRLARFMPTVGLYKQVLSFNGKILWSVFSGQIKLYRDIEDFIYDAYVYIVLGETVMQATISVVNHNIYTNAPFMKGPVYSIVSGEVVP